MARKHGTNSDVANAWYHGDSHPYESYSGSVSHRGKWLYSYNTVIGVKVFGKVLLDTDRYSPTTSRHQEEIKYKDNIVKVSRYLLNSIGISFRHIESQVELVDYIGSAPGSGVKDLKFSTYIMSRWSYTVQPSGVLFTKNSTGDMYLLSDDGCRFIKQLPCEVKSVGEAWNVIQPKKLDMAICKMRIFRADMEDKTPPRGWERGYYKHGEWCYIELPLEPKLCRKVYKSMDRDMVLPGSSYEYYPTRMCRVMDIAWSHVPDFMYQLEAEDVLVSGQVRSEDNRYGMARLSTMKDVRLFLAVKDRAVKTWIRPRGY